MNFSFAELHSTWSDTPRFSARRLLQAKSLHDAEDYAGSNEIIELIIGDPKQVADDELVSGIEVLGLYALNLAHLQESEKLNHLFELAVSLPPSAYAPLLTAKLRSDLDLGHFESVDRACAAFIAEHKNPLHPLMPEFYRLRACALQRLGEVGEALGNGEAAYSLHWIAGDAPGAAYAANAVGVINMQADFTSALHWFERALGYYEKTSLRRKKSMVYLNIGIAHYKVGNFEKAGVHLKSALGLAPTNRAQCFANIALGNVHRLTRDFESARRHLHTAYNQAQELQYPREEALALEFLGDVYRDEGQAEAARRFYARAMAIALKIAPEGDVVMELRRRNGECFGLEGRPAEAMPELQRALEMSRAQKDRFEEGVTLRVMSEVAYRSHDLAAARRLVDKSVGLLQEIGARHEAAIALLHSAEVCLAEVESARGGAPVSERLEHAWRQATEALDLFLRIDVRWWTDKCRATVTRVSAMRTAAARDRSTPTSPTSYNPGDVVIHAGSAMRDLLELCDMFATSGDPVLITGETGTGKEVLARRLHRHSLRADRPLVVVNVAAIPHTMFEREFFGHTRGAFSGAERDSVGFAAQADGATLFLDEIGELPLEVQPKLLRLLQEGTYQAIGDPKPRRADIRLVAATNANLRQMVNDGKFRADLYFRLQTLELDILPLRDRPEDVLPLLRHFLSLAADRQVDLAEYFNRRSLAELARHEWPGNAREVSMVARRAHLGLTTRGCVQVAIACADGSTLVAEGPHETAAPPPPAPAGLTADEAAERTRILLAIEENGGSRLHAARTLGMGRSTLYRRLTQLGIATRRD